MGSAGIDRSAPSGSLLGQKYRLLRPIGQGAFGCVYEAEHAELGRRYAVKLLHGAANSGRSRNRFAREARLLARLEHENVVSLIDAGEDAELGQYLVLEFIRGSTLREAFVTFQGAPPQRVLDVVRQIARGLSHAHTAGIVHRDLKPENVMLTNHADGRPLVKILDFGIARIFDDEATITSSGAALGTAAYMAPEQARGDRDIDHRVDVYALGVIVYELLSGVRPFDGSSYNETLFQILTKPHAPLARLRRDLPAAVCDAVDRALSKERGQRFTSVEDFAGAFARALGAPGPLETLGDLDSRETSVEARAPVFDAAEQSSRASAGPTRRSTLLRLVGAGLLPGILLGLLAGVAFQRSRNSGEEPAASALPSLPPQAYPAAAASPQPVPSAMPEPEPNTTAESTPSATPSNSVPSVTRSMPAASARGAGRTAPPAPVRTPQPRRDRGF